MQRESPVPVSAMRTLTMKTECSILRHGRSQIRCCRPLRTEAAFAVCFEGIYRNGFGENLGWVLDPKNAELRVKLRRAFADWYDQANKEQDENCVILAVHITRASIMRDHGAVCSHLDFVNKSEAEE